MDKTETENLINNVIYGNASITVKNFPAIREFIKYFIGDLEGINESPIKFTEIYLKNWSKFKLTEEEIETLKTDPKSIEKYPAELQTMLMSTFTTINFLSRGAKIQQILIDFLEKENEKLKLELSELNGGRKKRRKNWKKKKASN